MKIIKRHQNSNNIVVLFATNKEELVLLSAICSNVKIPKTPDTEIVRNRLHTIKAGLRKAIAEWDDIKIEND